MKTQRYILIRKQALDCRVVTLKQLETTVRLPVDHIKSEDFGRN